MAGNTLRSPQRATEIAEIGRLGFRGIGFVTIMASPGLDPHKALDFAERVVAMMRKEIADDEPDYLW